MLRLSRPLQHMCSARPQLSSRSLNIRPTLASPVRRTFSNHQPVSHILKSTSSTSGKTSAASYSWGLRGIVGATALMGAALGLAASQRPVVLCEAPPAEFKQKVASPDPHLDPDALPPPPQSSVNLYELSFGTVCGVCTGVFVKKGAKALAFVLGGVFVMLQVRVVPVHFVRKHVAHQLGFLLLQYFASLHLVRVNWSRAESGFQELFYSKSTSVGGQETRRPPTVLALWRWLVDFLTADFQPRASFIAGMALGLRIG
ncbi:hypothetical protein DFH11DRAFT_1700005 [Phellopilus nigrolimitatus]|nr:hypothetical protein DFH11DRAFT_1700005 [Phellopilus nigrolimitatus]